MLRLIQVLFKWYIIFWYKLSFRCAIDFLSHFASIICFTKNLQYHKTKTGNFKRVSYNLKHSDLRWQFLDICAIVSSVPTYVDIFIFHDFHWQSSCYFINFRVNVIIVNIVIACEHYWRTQLICDLKTDKKTLELYIISKFICI